MPRQILEHIEMAVCFDVSIQCHYSWLYNLPTASCFICMESTEEKLTLTVYEDTFAPSLLGLEVGSLQVTAIVIYMVS